MSKGLQISLWKIIDLGWKIATLNRIGPITKTQYLSLVDPIIEELDQCGLESAVAARSFKSVEGINRLQGVSPISGGMQAGIRQNLQVLLDALHSEAGNIDVLYLSVSDVSERLRKLPDSRELNEAQTELFDESVRCLECGAYRAASVMVWNLCYDIVRQWIHSDQDRLEKFNDFLESSYRRRGRDGNDKGPKYSKIVDYDEFFLSGAPSERDVVDTAESSQLIGGKVADRLRECLRDRNDLAHPSDKSITAIQANALVEKLIDIVQKTPFTG